MRDDIQKLIDLLPEDLHDRVINRDNLIEIILDLGRPVVLRYKDDKIKLDDKIVDSKMLDYAIFKVGTFGPDNRTGINGTLHRISQIKNRTGDIIGLTCRIGKVFEGSVDLLRDLVLSGKSILLVGKPGLGKTTKLRGVARYLANDLGKNVVIVDSSNEIAGDGNVPHPAVGDSRRLQVPLKTNQHDVMIEAVQNHTPDCIIIDEMGTEMEAQAARTIAQRGVQLIATAHGRKLDDLMKNPPLKALIGGVKSVTVGDKRAENTGSGKLILEREMEPTFDVVVELLDFDEVCVYHNVAESVDCILADGYCRPERRRLDPEGRLIVIETYKVAMPLRENTFKVPISEQLNTKAASNGHAKQSTRISRRKNG